MRGDKLPLPKLWVLPEGVVPVFPKGIENIAKKTITNFHQVHKDGSECMYPFCVEEHDEYEVEYTRTAIKKIDKA